MTTKELFIFRSNGNYIGFVRDSTIFSRDGVYLGWIENNRFVWDSNGRFGGVLQEFNGNKYIFINKLSVMPFSRPARPTPSTVSIPNPPANIPKIDLPIGYTDTF
ncbi:MAG: hypothetical protein V2A63_01055 [Patescibacteria group bacterium]